MMAAAATDHVFVDEGHTLDFTNKAFEAVGLLGWPAAESVLPTLVAQTAGAHRHEEDGVWRHPHDLAGLLARPTLEYRDTPANEFDDEATAALAWALLADEPQPVVAALVDAAATGASPSSWAGRWRWRPGCASPASTPRTTTVTGTSSTTASPTPTPCTSDSPPIPPPSCCAGSSPALKVYLDRFLNIPAARLAEADRPPLDELQGAGTTKGHVDRAGEIAYGHLRTGGDPAELIAALGHALLAEDAEFHWFQTVEAAARQFHAWPDRVGAQALLLRPPPGSSPPTPPPAASSPRWCASPPGCAAAKNCSRKPKPHRRTS